MDGLIACMRLRPRTVHNYSKLPPVKKVNTLLRGKIVEMYPFSPKALP